MKKFWENPVNDVIVPQGVCVPESFQIGNVQIAPATVLAPMAGGTDTVFRRFIRNASFSRSAPDGMSGAVFDPEAVGAEVSCDEARPGCGLLMTEFTSADGLFRTREKKRKRYLHFYQD